jgi:hypothetical protein
MNIPFDILEEGTATLAPGAVPAKVHAQVEKMFEEIEKLLGGKHTREANKGKKFHGHHHDHQHLNQ